MKGYIEVVEIAVKRDTPSNVKFVYPSLIRVCAQTYEDCAELARKLVENGLVNTVTMNDDISMNNLSFEGTAIGFPEVNWTVSIIKFITEENARGNTVYLSMNKQFLVTWGVRDEDDWDTELPETIREKIFDTYAYRLWSVVQTCGASSIFKCKATGKEHAEIRSVIKDKIYLDDRKRGLWV